MNPDDAFELTPAELTEINTLRQKLQEEAILVANLDVQIQTLERQRTMAVAPYKAAMATVMTRVQLACESHDRDPGLGWQVSPEGTVTRVGA